jgi:hypothetical protein
MKRNWTDLRDGLVWEIEATQDTLRFSSQGGGIHRLNVDPDVGSRLNELSDAELARYLDEARSGGQL